MKLPRMGRTTASDMLSGYSKKAARALTTNLSNPYDQVLTLYLHQVYHNTKNMVKYNSILNIELHTFFFDSSNDKTNEGSSPTLSTLFP